MIVKEGSGREKKQKNDTHTYETENTRNPETEVSFLNDGNAARVVLNFSSYKTNDCAHFLFCLTDGNFSALGLFLLRI